MNLEKQKTFLIRCAYYCVIAAGIYLGITFILPPLMPFAIGFLIAWLLHYPAEFLAKKLRISPKVPSLLFTACFFLLAAALLLLLGFEVTAAVKNVIPQIPVFLTQKILPLIQGGMEELQIWAAQINPAIVAEIETQIASLSESVSQIVTSISAATVKAVSGFAAAMPGFFVKVVLSIVSAFFFSKDYRIITNFVKKLMPESGWNILTKIKEKAVSSVKVFICSYTILFLITFAELTIGLMLLKIPYALGLALLIALFDLLPVLGVGGILIPWAVISLVTGNIPMAAGVLVLYIVTVVVRNMVEPKLVGAQIGLHPLATMMSMFLGLQLCGIAGMLLFPVGLSLLVQFQKDGVIKGIDLQHK